MAKGKSGRSSTNSRNRKGYRAGKKKTIIWVGAGLLVIAVMAIVSTWLWRVFEHKPDFQGAHALQHIHTQVSFGARVPGTPAHIRTRDYLLNTLDSLADRAEVQTFTFTDQHDTTRVYEGFNIVASFNLKPASGRRVMLSAHWDSRPRADQDKEALKRNHPVPGANDGASGVAVLLEMARLLKENPPDVGVDIVLFDLEDLGDEPTADTTRPVNPFGVGSETFVASNPDYRPAFGILLDMVCDSRLQIPREANSDAAARPIVDLVWDAAKRTGSTVFVDRPGSGVYDDHIAFLKRGIRVIDLIHSPFPSYWHTTADTPDKCSVNSLQQVGDVLVEVIYSE